MTTTIAWIVAALIIFLFAYVAFLVFASIRRNRFAGSVRGFWVGASDAEELCALGTIGRFCVAPQLHR